MNTASIIAPAFVHASIKRRKNAWYSVKDGNWSDPTVWISNATKRWGYPGLAVTTPIFPAVGDDVYIDHVLTISTTSVTLTVNNLFISGTLKSNNNANVLIVNGDFQVIGSLDMTSSNLYLTLKGVNNYMNSFTRGTCTINYGRSGTGSQQIMPFDYYNLTISGTHTKYITTTTTIFNNFYSNGATGIDDSNILILQLGIYNLTVTGSSTLNNAKLMKSGSGNVLFIGVCIVQGFTTATIDFSAGNPTVEFRGGLSVGCYQRALTTGTSQWKFTTNNQTIDSSNYSPPIFDCPVLISGAITVTIVNGYAGFPDSCYALFNNDVNGDNAGSTLKNSGAIWFAKASPVIMTTGIFDWDYANTGIGYVMNANFTLPYTNYRGLRVEGTGTKTLSANTIVRERFISKLGGATTDCSTYDLSVLGYTDMVSSTLLKTTSGALVFGGLIGSQAATFTFSGNPTVELRGGLNIQNGTINSGTGLWSFTTNNQSVTLFTGDVMNCPFLISGAIKITNSGMNIIAGVFDGNNASSELDNRATGGLTFSYQNTTRPMVTGILTTNAAANTFRYIKAGNQDVKGGTYRTIEFGGSGNKTLQGNVIINVTAGGSQSTTGTAVVVLNGFTITTI